MDALDLIREGKIKRCFLATRKLNAHDLLYHITQRAAGKEPLFVEAIKKMPAVEEIRDRLGWRLFFEQAFS